MSSKEESSVQGDNCDADADLTSLLFDYEGTDDNLLEQLFDTVLEWITNKSDDTITTNDSEKLTFYGLYKHITVGPAKTKCLRPPSIFQATAYLKYRSWVSYEHLSKREAILKYIELAVAKNKKLEQECKKMVLDETKQQHQQEQQKENKEPSKSNKCENNNRQYEKNMDNAKKDKKAAIIDKNDGDCDTAAMNDDGRNTVLPFIYDLISWLLLTAFNIRPIIPRGKIDISYTDLVFATLQCFRCFFSSVFFLTSSLSQTEEELRIATLCSNNVLTTEKNDNNSTIVSGISVRSLLDVFLIHKKYPPGSEIIIVPPINTPAMIQVLNFHKIKISPIDLPNDSSFRVDMNAIQKSITKKTVAVMIVHPFGCYSTTNDEMYSIRRMVKNHNSNIIILEDCAECFHGLHNDNNDNNTSPSLLGNSMCADISFFSFGILKTSTALGGGIAVVCNNNNNVSIATEMKRLQQSMYRKQTTKEFFTKICKALLICVIGDSPLLYGCIEKLCSLFAMDFDAFITRNVRNFQSPPPKLIKHKKKIATYNGDETIKMKNQINLHRVIPSTVLLSLLRRRLQQSKNQRPSSVVTRINRCKYMNQILEQQKVTSSMIIKLHPSAMNTFWLYPVRIPFDLREKFRKILLKSGFDISEGSTQLCCVSDYMENAQQHQLCCSRAEKVMQEILYLPIASRNFNHTKIRQLASCMEKVTTRDNNLDNDDTTILGNKRETEHPGRNIQTFIKLFSLFGVLFMYLFLGFISSLRTIATLTFVVAPVIVLTFVAFRFIFTILFSQILRWLITPMYMKSEVFAKYNSIGFVATSKPEPTNNELISNESNTNQNNNNNNNDHFDFSSFSPVFSSTARRRQRLDTIVSDDLSGSCQSSSNRTILTGATGFIGSLILRDLLLHRKSLLLEGGIIVLCRSKRKVSAEERFIEILKQDMFSFLSDQEKKDLVIVVEGDVSQKNAGIKTSDLSKIYNDQSITHVIHCAASVSFVQSIADAANGTIKGALNMQNLAKKCKNKSVKFVHLSTAFVHGALLGSESKPLPEQLYNFHPYDPLKIYESILGTQFYACKAMNDLRFDNTYTFCKSLCEHLLLQNDDNGNTIIIRPSIVGPSVAEPYVGWMGEKPTTLVAAAFLYYIYQYNIWSFKSIKVPCIPVDIVSKFVLLKAFHNDSSQLPPPLSTEWSSSDDSAKEEDIDTSCCSRESESTYSTDDGFEKIRNSSTSDTTKKNNISTSPAKIPSSLVQSKNIYNCSWDAMSHPNSVFTWEEYVIATIHYGAIMGYFNRRTVFLGLLVTFKMLPKLNVTIGSFKKIHNVLVKLPLSFAIWGCKKLGYNTSGLSLLYKIVDLPLLFFTYMNNEFHFRSELVISENFSGEKYVSNCIASAHKFVQKMKSAGKIKGVKNINQNPTHIIVGGKYHDHLLSDLSWAMTQPNGNYFIRFAGWVFTKILRATCREVTVDTTSFELIHAKTEMEQNDNDPVHIILAPTHRSIYDFLLLSYIFFALPELKIDIPWIAAAEDFDALPVLGWLARCMRAFYIRRGRGFSDPSLLNDLVSVKESSKHGLGLNAIEVYIEGKRSRDRRFVDPKTGFLKSLGNSGGKHIIVPITISYERLPEQDILTVEVTSGNRSRLNIIGLLSWIKQVLCGNIKLGRIHVAANKPISMNSQTNSNYKELVNEIQLCQQEKLYISEYHIEAAAILLKLDTKTVHQALAKLECNFWPTSLPCCKKDLPVLPTDSSELLTIMLHFGHHLSPLFRSKKTSWSRWLNRLSRSLDDDVYSDPSILVLTDSLWNMFTEADKVVEEAFEILKEKGFHYPKFDHLFQTICKQRSTIPPLLLRAAASLHPMSTCVVKSGSELNTRTGSDELPKLTESKEMLGYWGFADSAFIARVNQNGMPYVTMKGNRYSLCNKSMTRLIPFLESQTNIKLDLFNEAFSVAMDENVAPSQLDLNSSKALREIIPKMSLSFHDRVRHGAGHSHEDIFSIRSGKVMRIPDAVVWPLCEVDISNLVSLAKEKRWCLIPHGGGTNVTNATRCPSLQEEERQIISVDMTKMNRILWLNEEDGLAHVEAGINGRDLVNAMKERGFTIGHEPDSFEFSTLGGWIATKASGMKRNKYGNIEDIVRAVEVAGSNGLFWKGKQGSHNIPGRESTGLDLYSLMLGSEGCLGIITSAVIRVWPISEVKEFDSVLLPDFEIGLRFVRDVGRSAQTIPASVRLLDNLHFRLGQAMTPDSPSMLGKVSSLLKATVIKNYGKFDSGSVVCVTITYEGNKGEIKQQKTLMRSISKKHGGLSLGSQIGSKGYDMTFMIAYLRDFAMTYHFLGDSFETFAPWSKIEAIVKQTTECVKKEHTARFLPGCPLVACRITQIYHEGVCLYFYFCMNFENVQDASEVFSEIESAARSEILKQGGSLSHHHGIGKVRSNLLMNTTTSAFRDTVTLIKKSMDKENIFGARNGLYGVSKDEGS